MNTAANRSIGSPLHFHVIASSLSVWIAAQQHSVAALISLPKCGRSSGLQRPAEPVLAAGADKADDSVAPNATYKYVWEVRERSGPGPADPSSVVWMYHSHRAEVQDTISGLYGAMIVSRKASPAGFEGLRFSWRRGGYPVNPARQSLKGGTHAHAAEPDLYACCSPAAAHPGQGAELSRCSGAQREVSSTVQSLHVSASSVVSCAPAGAGTPGWLPHGRGPRVCGHVLGGPRAHDLLRRSAHKFPLSSVQVCAGRA